MRSTTLLALIALLAAAAVPVCADGWMYVDAPRVGFYTMDNTCSFGDSRCWFTFAEPFYVDADEGIVIYRAEIWNRSWEFVWFKNLYIPGITPEPMSFGVKVVDCNATIDIVSSDTIRIVAYAPTGTVSMVVLFGIKPYSIKLNGYEIKYRAVHSLDELMNMSVGWFHDGAALYLRAVHSSPVVWEIKLSETPTEEAPPVEGEPIMVLPAATETSTPAETHSYTVYIQLPGGGRVDLFTLIIVAAFVAFVVFLVLRRL